MKLNLVLPLFLVASASAFAPSSQAFVRQSALRMSDEPPTEAPPAPAPAAPPKSETAIVPVKEETVEFTAGILGGVAGFALGGPVLGAIGAAAANYVSKNEGEVSEVVSTVSKTSIELYNYLAKLDNKYELLTKAKGSLEDAIDKLKSKGNVDPESIEKVEKALATTKSKITESMTSMIWLVPVFTALGVVGDLVEKAVVKAGELNEEYKLTDKAKDALKTAVEKAKDAKASM